MLTQAQISDFLNDVFGCIQIIGESGDIHKWQAGCLHGRPVFELDLGTKYFRGVGTSCPDAENSPQDFVFDQPT